MTYSNYIEKIETIEVSDLKDKDFILYIKEVVKDVKLSGTIVNFIHVTNMYSYAWKVSYGIFYGNKLAIKDSSEKDLTINSLIVLLYILYKNQNIKNIVIKNLVFNSISNFNIKNNLDKFMNLISKLDFTIYLEQDVIKLFPRSSLDILI